jgi:hypothetical protein
MPAVYDSTIREISRFCRDRANEIADDDGFVSVAKLAESLRSQIIARPLLVEAMLASREESTSIEPNSARWIILLNSQKFSVNEWELIREDSNNPLSGRIRNTIAHELVHLLILQREKNHKPSKTTKKMIEALERDVVKLSPLLLVSGKSLNGLFSNEKASLSISDLVHFCKKYGVSRQAFLNRINHLKVLDEGHVLDRSCLQNIAFGLGEWINDGQPRLLRQALFVQFDRNIYPSFLHSLAKNDPPTIRDIFTDERFYLNHGDALMTSAEIDAGTERSQFIEKMRVMLTVERVSKHDEKQFFFLLQLIDN